MYTSARVTIRLTLAYLFGKTHYKHGGPTSVRNLLINERLLRNDGMHGSCLARW